MIIGTSYSPTIRATRRSSVRLHFVCECDGCHRIFTSKNSQTTRLKNNKHQLTFCSGKCCSHSSARVKKCAKTNIVRYGGVAPMCSLTVREKSHTTCLKRYSSKTYLGSTTASQKIRNSMNERYGVDYATQLSDFNEKRKNTWMSLYGVDNPMKSESFRAKLVSSCLERHGVENVFKLQAVKEKIKMTCLKHHGVTHHMKSDVIKQRVDKRFASKLRHNTMKIRGIYSRQASSTENALYHALVERYGYEHVKRHVNVNDWCIDLYVDKLNTFIQHDGVYWHGLDRSLDDILKFKNPRDKTIYDTFCRDRKQDAWFLENQLILFRTTDQVTPADVIQQLDVRSA